jgi:hypothetical protein
MIARCKRPFLLIIITQSGNQCKLFMNNVIEKLNYPQIYIIKAFMVHMLHYTYGQYSHFAVICVE